MLIGASALSVLAILSIVGYLLVREYRNTEEDAARSALNIVQLISRDIQNTLSIYDSSLSNLIDLLQSQALSSLAPPIQQSLLFDKATEVEERDRERSIRIARSAPVRDYESEICTGCDYATSTNFGKRCEAWAECLQDLAKRERAGQ